MLAPKSDILTSYKHDKYGEPFLQVSIWGHIAKANTR